MAVAVVERLKQESMYGLSVEQKSGFCREVAVSGVSTVSLLLCKILTDQLLLDWHIVVLTK